MAIVVVDVDLIFPSVTLLGKVTGTPNIRRA